MANAGSLAVGIESGKRWQSGCWDKEWQTLAVWLYAGRHQADGTQETSTALSLTRGLSLSDRLGPRPSVLSRHVMDLNQNTRSRHATGIAHRVRDVDRDPHNVHARTHARTHEEEEEERERKVVNKVGRRRLQTHHEEGRTSIQEALHDLFLEPC